ncbi:MAG: histidine--tRNA ligase [Candidatus Jorgensenbacteria bacterium]
MPHPPVQKKSDGSKSEGKQPFQSVKGMADLLPKDAPWWRMMTDAARTVSELHDFRFIETPIVELANLFESGVGIATDIVEKQMYVFKTKGDDRVALRPEGTAPVMRSYLEHHLGYFASPLKVFYCGPMFRYERPQEGRYRQFHQWGVEVLGDGDSIYDGEVILAAMDFLKALKLKDPLLKINTIGCRVCRPGYRERLKAYYQERKAKLCKDCERRLQANPLRLLDCKEKGCEELKKDAPIILDYLCQACNNHFKTVLELVEDNGISYEPDPYLVRGLDYYNRTVFEIMSGSYPAALGSGGRYDYLSEQLGGRMVPAVGIAMGLERVMEALRKEGVVPPQVRSKPAIFFAAVGEQAKKSSLKIMRELRANGMVVVEALGKRTLKAQLKAAAKSKVPLALLFGQREMFEGSVILRNMVTGAQETVVLSRLVEEVKKRLR